jgi:alpha-L-arabinofuranosidase
VHTRTSYGAAYEIIRTVFENSEMCESTIDSTKIGDGLDAVSAEAVIKDGKVIVFAVNKTTDSVPFVVNFDGVNNAQRGIHQTLSFSDMKEPRSFGLEEELMTELEFQGGRIILPPMSLNRIDGLSLVR